MKWRQDILQFNKKLYYVQLHQCTETVNFIYNLIIIDYCKHLFLHYEKNPKNKCLKPVYIGQHMCCALAFGNILLSVLSFFLNQGCIVHIDPCFLSSSYTFMCGSCL